MKRLRDDAHIRFSGSLNVRFLLLVVMRTPRGPNRFKEREVTRVLRAAKAAGNVERVEIAADGSLRLILKDGDKRQVNEVDEWMAKHARAPEGH